MVGEGSRIGPAILDLTGLHPWPEVSGSAPTTDPSSARTATEPPSVTNSTDTSTNVGSAYTALSPHRLVDTRPGSGSPYEGNTLQSNSTLVITVTGVDGVPADATAVSLNVTVVDGTAPSFLQLYPVGASHPAVSNLNWSPGQTIPNLVIVPVGTGGRVNIYNNTGRVDVIADLEGYFAPVTGGSTAGSYVALSPARITDTRYESGYPNSGDTLGPGGSLNVQVTGAGEVPGGTSDVEAALLNVTVVDTTAVSYLTVYPEGGSVPLASNLNWAAGETVPNRVVVPINSSNGEITVFNAVGRTDVLVDVDGYFTKGTAQAGASLYTPISPQRLVDTRAGSGEFGSGQTLGPDATLPEPLASLGSLGSDVTAVVSNVTVTDTTAASFLTVYPGPTFPGASDLNWAAGHTVANLAVATVSSTGSVSFFNDVGRADVIADVFGYFSITATLDGAGCGPSGNWSGYIEGNGPNTSVTGTFSVPSLYAGDPDGSNMSQWVGLDGWESDTQLIQSGIDEVPNSTMPGYFSIVPWWEILPAAETPITTLATLVAAGDSITIAISQVSGSTWEISFTDNTSGDNFTTDQTYTGSGTTADWIVEAPLSGGTQTSLADYTPTGFTGIGARGSDTADEAVFMAQGMPAVTVSVPSGVGEGGSSFNVAYGGTIPYPPP